MARRKNRQLAPYSDERYEIDFNLISNVTDIATSYPPILPKKTRKFGYVLDLSELLSGDIILFCDTENSKSSNAINSAQKTIAGYSKTDSKWTHAAIYMDNGKLIEAVPRKGVTIADIHDSIPGCLLRVRRNPHLEELQRLRIVIAAMSQLGKPYGMQYAISMLGKFATPSTWSLGRQGVHSNICSNLCNRAYIEGAQIFPASTENLDQVPPALLSATNSLKDVRVRWLKIPVE